MTGYLLKNLEHDKNFHLYENWFISSAHSTKWRMCYLLKCLWTSQPISFPLYCGIKAYKWNITTIQQFFTTFIISATPSWYGEHVVWCTRVTTSSTNCQHSSFFSSLWIQSEIAFWFNFPPSSAALLCFISFISWLRLSSAASNDDHDFWPTSVQLLSSNIRIILLYYSTGISPSRKHWKE